MVSGGSRWPGLVALHLPDGRLRVFPRSGGVGGRVVGRCSLPWHRSVRWLETLLRDCAEGYVNRCSRPWSLSLRVLSMVSQGLAVGC
ncbi:hypothetical protein chiPu_0028592 [Chiloscyllium punctatum]|uniref:Uncharacterized protein n=1 Tax=Chiloscyllium punctatum TaxID=137246 RepID=A0A401TNU0_CHIPU|nr:hypothetical protein [Chiloscyllium punctatum]